MIGHIEFEISRKITLLVRILRYEIFTIHITTFNNAKQLVLNQIALSYVMSFAIQLVLETIHLLL